MRHATRKNRMIGVETLEGRRVMAANFSLVAPSVAIVEGEKATFTLSLAEGSRSQETVFITTKSGTAMYGKDFFAPQSPLKIVFAPGQTTKTFTIATLRDAGGDVKEGIETFEVIATAARSAWGTITRTVEIDDYSSDVRQFDITVLYPDPVLPALKQVVDKAVDKWESVIVGDLPSYVNPYNGVKVDDIVLDVRIGLLGIETGTDDEGGTLANAGPVYITSDSTFSAVAIRDTAVMLPYWSTIGFDPADVASSPAEALYATALHEIGHCLGFGQVLFSRARPRFPQGLADYTDVDNPVFLGANALREYRVAFNVNSNSVPLEGGTVQGTSGSHWRESVFDNELMTGELNSLISPLSRITVGAMQDLGYRVNYGAADPYSKPSSGGSGGGSGGGGGGNSPVTSGLTNGGNGSAPSTSPTVSDEGSGSGKGADVAPGSAGTGGGAPSRAPTAVRAGARASGRVSAASRARNDFFSAF